MAVMTDPPEYSDFTVETSFKSLGGRFDCSGGLIFRYVDDKNFYLLSAGCPSDYFALSRMTNGKLDVLKQSVVPTDRDTGTSSRSTRRADTSCATTTAR